MLKSWFNHKDEVTSNKIIDMSTEKLLNLLQNLSKYEPIETYQLASCNITEEEYQFLRQLGLIEYRDHMVLLTEKGELAKQQLFNYPGISLQELLIRL